MSRRHMDWSGNIVETDEEPALKVVHTTEGTEKELREVVCDPFEQHMANINQDEEDMELTETPCQFDAQDLIACPNFFPADLDEEVPDVIECRVCGRMDWKRKSSKGATLGDEKLV